MEKYELTSEQWERVKPIIPPETTGKRGRPRKDDRTMLIVVYHILTDFALEI